MNSEFIQTIIQKFYERATTDIFIGFQFRDVDMNEHIPRIVNFWRMQLLGETGLEENPFNLIQAHSYLHVKRGQVDRWMVLFFEVLDQSNGDQDFIDRWKVKVITLRQAFP